MQPSFLLLLCTQLFLGTLASDTSFDTFRGRDVGEIRYKVHAIDLTKTDETEVLLKHSFGDENVITEHFDNDAPTWTIVSLGDDLTDAINQLDAVRVVEPATEPQTQSPRPRNTLGPRDDGIYMAIPAPGSDTKKIDEFIQSKVKPGTEVARIAYGDRIMAWSNLHLDSAAKDAIGSFDGVDKIEPALVGHYNRALPASSMGRAQLRALYKRNTTSFAGEWSKQADADDALITVSEYPGMELKGARDYVYQKDAGKDVFVYVIDAGVNFNVINVDGEQEFITEQGKVLQTPRSIAEGKKKEEDDAPARADSHGTIVASKAVGKKYGVAKHATLIPVKISVTEHADIFAGLNMIIDDIKANPGRNLKSVVTTSRALGEGMSLDKVQKFTPGEKALFVVPIEQLFELGVPFVCAAGNQAADPYYVKYIDELPMVIKDEKHPIINIGATTWYGVRAPFSQYGDQLDLYAVGHDLKGQTKRDKEEAARKEGTSYASPQVAGVVAAYLSTSVSDPWKTLTGYKRVEAIKDYLLSDKSSWVRNKNSDTGKELRVIWNGALKEDHKSVGANPGSDSVPEPVPEPESPPRPVPEPTPRAIRV